MKHWYRVSDPLVKQNHSGAPSSHLTFIHSLYSPLAILHCFSDCFYCCFLCFLLLTTCLFPSLGNKLHINEFDSRFFFFLKSFSVRVRTKTFFLWLLVLNENNKTKNEKKEGWGLRIHSPGTKLVSSNLSGCFFFRAGSNLGSLDQRHSTKASKVQVRGHSKGRIHLKAQMKSTEIQINETEPQEESSSKGTAR